MEIEVVDHSVKGHIDIKASPGKVFDALCHGERWWGSPEMYQVKATAENMVLGGDYISEGTLPDGSPFYVKGKVVVFEPPVALSYTWNASWQLDMPETTVSFILEPTEIGTRVHLTHGSFVGHSESSADHYLGWTTVMGWLQDYCELALVTV